MQKKEHKEYEKLKMGELKNPNDTKVSGELMEADLFETKQTAQKIDEERKADQKKRSGEQEKQFKSEQKRRKRKAFLNPYKKFFKSIISMNTYVGMIQNFEELILVIFIDSLMLFTLASLSYIIYMMFTSKPEDNLPVLIFKASAGIVVSTICLVAQANIPIANKPTKIIDEED